MNLPIIKKQNAIIKLDSGPARDISKTSLLGCFRLYKSYSTGLPQPKPASTKRSNPIGSIWERGFRVTLPWYLGVESPNLYAAQAWANSWIVIEKIKQEIKIKKLSGLENNMSNIQFIIVKITSNSNILVLKYQNEIVLLHSRSCIRAKNCTMAE
jgi:hypothetical protein